ncbi:DUF120 domain-containing protein [Candidatus Woesearchaeota archaeon]|nr:DUF120 domain-containing protein [Candidatus Woesearchaeota archaeon]
MFEEELPLLLHIAEITLLHKPVKIQTNDIAVIFGFSQQTASRKLMELEGKGFISRAVFVDGIELKLTAKAKKCLDEHYLLLKSLYEPDGLQKSLHGIVKTGLGEGKFYIQIKQYKEAFEQKLQFTPYSGTLNLQVDAFARKEFLSHKKMIKIDGFSTPERTYGGIFCYPVNIKKQNTNKQKKSVAGALIIPERTNHPENIAELIAPVYLRSVLSIKDDDIIEVE